MNLEEARKVVDEQLEHQVRSHAEFVEKTLRDGRFDEFLDHVLDMSRKQAWNPNKNKWETTGYEFCLAWGGPGIWFNTWDCEIEGHWSGSESRVKLPRDVCDAIDDYLNEIYGEG